jgi:Tfp pilus assembly protein PilF
MSARVARLAPIALADRSGADSLARAAASRLRGTIVARMAGGAVALGLALAAVPAGAQAPFGSFAPALAQPPGDADAVRAGSRGFSILLDQANYWSAQGRPDLAQQALERLLMLGPNNPEVLATAVEVASQNGDRQTAETYLARLNQAAPNSDAAYRASSALRAMVVDQAVLAEARRLTQAGQRQAAMQRYRELFPNGEVPPIFAVEYYQTLAGSSEEHFELARQGLAGVLERSPENGPLQLAYAQLLSYNEIHRPEGIQRLRQLAGAPAIGPAARAAWRQALLWLPVDPETADYIGTYLQTNATDQEIQTKYEEAKATIIPPWIGERIAGFTAIGDNRFADAERHFEAARAGNSGDAESIIGVVILRKIQERYTEARQLFEEAVALAPDRREEFAEKTGDLNPPPVVNYARGGRGRAGPPSNSTLAWQNLTRGALDRADNHARRALRGNAEERAQGEIVLGYVALRRDDFSTAETRFRTALTIRRGLPGAQAGLYEALQRQGRFADADRFLADTGFRPPAGSQAFRAAALRQEAQRAGDANEQIALLRGALAADPGNAWAAYDLARALKSRGQVEEARQVERTLATRRAPDALFASALLSNADGRLAESVQRLEAIPQGARTDDGNRLLTRNQRVLEVRQLERTARGNPRSDAARRMIALAGQPDPTGETAASVIRAFARLRQSSNADEAVRAANPGSPSTPPAARLAIAGAMLDAGRTAEAEALAASVERDPRLSGEARRQVAELRAGSAARAAEQLTSQGDRRGALERLSPALSQSPEDPQLRLSLARVYANSGRAGEASEIADPILARSPDNIQARAVAGEAAVMRNALGRAEEILRDGRTRGADELQMALLEARIARASGDQFRARQALETAARLRAGQLRVSSQ